MNHGHPLHESFWSESLQTAELLAPSLLTAGALAVAGAVVGFFVVLRREALLSLALPQVAAVGAAVALRLGWPTLPPALILVVITLAFLTVAVDQSNTLLPALYVGASATAILIIANSGADLAVLEHVLVGMDVTVSTSEAIIAAPVLLAVALLCAVLWRRWLLVAQVPEVAQLAGLRPRWWDRLFLTLLAIVVVLGTSTLGVVLVLAMLFLPASTVLPWAGRIPVALIAAITCSLLFLAFGFTISVWRDWPLSQSVAGVGFVALLFVQLLRFLHS